MSFKVLCGAVLGAVLFAGQAFATSAAPPHYTSPLSFAGRQFFVSPSGTDTATCGAGPMGATANCRTPWGADAATSIGATGTTLTGGDTVNVFGSTPSQTLLGSTGTTNYDLGAGKTFSRSGTANTPTGYINYVCSVNHGCKMSLSAASSFAAINLNAHYIAFDGFEVDGHNVQGYAGYSPSNTNTYFAGGQLFGQGTAASHHHMHLNFIYHSTGGGALGSISNQNDYEYDVAGEIYDFSGVNGSHTSGYNNFEVVGLTPVVGNTWDNDPFHIQGIGNVIHDGGETVNITTGHTDGEGFIQDTFGHVPQYPYGQLFAYNVVYSVGGRGILVFAGSTVDASTLTNNTVYGANMDLGAGGEGLDDTCSYHDTWQNNISYTNTAGRAAGWRTQGCGTVSNSTWHNNLTFNGTPGQASTVTDGTLTFVGNGNQLGVDPKLANVSAKDFHPLSSSPVLNAGLANPTSRIFAFMTPDGNVPSSPPNIGAFNLSGGSTGLGPVSINAGGPAVAGVPPQASFIADTAFAPVPGNTANNNPTGAVDTTLVVNPAPITVYRTERWGNPFTYTVNGLTPNTAYAVNLEFTEDWPADFGVGKRIENVSLNGTQVLSNFDIFATAGAAHKAVRKSFLQNSDVNGNIAITFTTATGSVDANAKVDGVSVLIPPRATLSASPSTINAGNSSTLTWSSANSSRCIGTGFSTNNAVSGSLVVTPSTTTTYSISCDAGGVATTASQVVTVNSTLSASLTASPTTVISGGASTLTWSSNATVKCVGTNFSTTNATSGTKVVNPTVTTTYSVACDSGGTPVNASTTVSVSPVTATISANPSTILNGQSSTLTWSSNGTRCTGVGPGTAPSGTLAVSPTQTTTYTIVCDNGGVSTSASTNVTVNLVTASLSASPSTLSNNVTISNSTGASIGASLSTTNSSAAPAQSYFEITLGSGISSANTLVGIGNASVSLTNFPGVDLNSVGWQWNTGNIFINNTHSNTNFVTGVANDVIAFAVDFTNNKLWVKNVTHSGGWNNDVIANQNPATNTGGYDISGLSGGPYFIMASVGAVNGEKLTLNAGTSAFIGGFPTGFTAWGSTTTFNPANTGSPAVLFTQSSTLTWASNGTRCIGTGFPTANAANGTQSVSPTVTTTYSVACDAGGAATTASTTVTVIATPSASIISSATAVPSNAATISWSSVNAAACTGTNFQTGGLTSGSVSVSPLSTTTYSVTCDNSPASSVTIIVPVLNCQAGPALMQLDCRPTTYFCCCYSTAMSGWLDCNCWWILSASHCHNGDRYLDISCKLEQFQ